MPTLTTDRDFPAKQELVPIFVSLELSRVRWLVTWTFHGSSKMSKTSVAAGDGAELLALLAQIRTRAERAQHAAGKIIVIQEAGRRATRSTARCCCAF